MPDSNFLKKAVVKVQSRSGFDKSFRNLLTTKCGTLTPLLCDELIANTSVHLRLAISATLPPLASETFMNVNLKCEAFFVPSRIIMKGFEQFIQGNDDIRVGGSANNTTDGKIRVPLVIVPSNNAGFGPGSLADYLGFRTTSVADNYLCALPFLAYHEIWNTWYRNPLVQKSIYEEDSFYATSASWNLQRVHRNIPNTVSGYTVGVGTYADNVKVTDLRQRNFGSDYFTVATPSPQNGQPQKISMSLPSGMRMHFSGGASDADLYVNSGDDSYLVPTLLESGDPSTDTDGYFDNVNFRPEGGSLTTSSSPQIGFTIASLRAANSLQQWLERNQLGNNKYVDFLKVQYNANLKDSIAQRPVYLGSASFPVYSKGIYQTAKDSSTGNNPFDSVGSRYGHAYAEGDNLIIDGYTTQEPGYLMVLVSLVPEATYSSGINKYLMRYLSNSSYGDHANPILQNVGPEPIYCYEFNNSFNDDDSYGVFGYTDRFASWMTRNNELHGLLRDGQSLDAFALQRSGLVDGISDQFLQIPTDYMDQVTAVDSAISNYGCWIDSYLDYKVSMPLARYCIPSLQDPAYEHGDTVVANRRGRIIE